MLLSDIIGPKLTDEPHSDVPCPSFHSQCGHPVRGRELKTIRVLLADDHTLVRAGMRSLLESIEGVEVVAESGDGHEALGLIEKHLPDVALLDIGMPGLSGLEVTRRISATFPRTRVVILAMHAGPSYVARPRNAGLREAPDARRVPGPRRLREPAGVGQLL